MILKIKKKNQKTTICKSYSTEMQKRKVQNLYILDWIISQIISKFGDSLTKSGKNLRGNPIQPNPNEFVNMPIISFSFILQKKKGSQGRHASINIYVMIFSMCDAT